jgi:hypothetical protein
MKFADSYLAHIFSNGTIELDFQFKSGANL